MINKEELIKRVARQTSYKQSDIKVVLDSILNNIALAMKDEGGVSLVGFGKFEAVERPARTGVNPGTRETINIPAMNIPHFKASVSLKELIK